MGAACCVAAKDKTITNRSPCEPLQRQVRYSPSWSFLWDNRGRVAGEETSIIWLHDEGVTNNRLEVKSGVTGEPAFASEEGSPWQKSPVSDGNTGVLRLPSSDQSIPRNLIEVKGSTESTSLSYPSSMKLSPSEPSISSLPASPLSSQSHLLPPNSTPRWHHRSPGPCSLRQVSDTRIPEYKSPSFSISEETSPFQPPAWSNELTGGSNGGSSDGWSIHAFSELMTTRKERWSFDSETSGFSLDKFTRSSGRNSGFPSFDLQTCSICARLLTERSAWGCSSQKIISTNELAVVSVLTCGHVYHAECLECMTPEINKYDPACPICTFGEKRAFKMFEKALKAELDSKAKKRSKNRVVVSDLNRDFVFAHHKNNGVEGRGPKMSSSSSMNSSLGKPFLKRHFSFGSRGDRSLSEDHSTGKKGFFWARSSKNLAF